MARRSSIVQWFEQRFGQHHGRRPGWRVGWRRGAPRRALSAVLAASLVVAGLVVLTESPAAAAEQTFAYTPGTTVSDGVPAVGAGNIEQSGDADLYAFEATAGQMLTLTELGCTPSGYSGTCSLGYLSWRLKRPSDTDGAMDTGTFSALGSTHWTAPETGTYTLEVRTQTNANPAYYTATYSFVLSATDEVHETFAYSMGTTVSDGVPTVGQGNLETSGASDTYTFSATAGQMLSFTRLGCTNTGSSAFGCNYANWRLKRPSDTTGYWAGGSLNSLGTNHWTVPETGTYSLVIDQPGHANPSHFNATYSFVFITTDEVHESFDYSMGTTVSDGVPTVGQGNLETSGASDTYTFSATAGQMLSFTRLGCTSTGSSALGCNYANWRLKRPSDTTGYLAGGSLNSLGTNHWTVPETGTYSLVIDQPGHANPSHFNATYSFVFITTDEVHESFDYSMGTTVSDGVPTVGQGNLETSGASDTYTFSATAGQMLSFTRLGCTSTGSSALGCNYANWRLKRPSDTTGYWAIGSLNSLGTNHWTMPETGTYSLVIDQPGHANPSHFNATYSFVVFSAEGTVPSIGSFNVSPSSGSAPLAVSASVTATDADGDPLTYSIDWGDGTAPSTGSLPTSGVAHTYTSPGTYQATVWVSDGTNPAVTAQRTVTVSSPTPPVVNSFTVTPNAGVGPLEVQASFSASDPDGDPLTYSIDWGDGTTPTTGSYPAGTKTHTYVNPGTYHPTVTVSDGTSTDAESRTVLVTPDQPLAANAGDDRITAVGESVVFDGGNSTPAAVIESYEWSFSDGVQLSGAVVDRTFPSAGTYTATLTVEASGVTRVDSATVTVVPADTGVEVTVRSGGAAVVGAQVLVQTDEGVQVSGVTGGDGVATLWGLADGEHAVFAYKSGFIGATATVAVADGNGSVIVDLPTGSPGSVEIETRPMTYEEIIAAGIDPNDPDNQHVFEYEIVLIFGPEIVSFTYYVSGGGGIVGGIGGVPGGPVTVGGSVFVPTVQSIGEDVPPAINYLVIPGEARWLKEFFEVRLIVSNMAPTGFTFTQGTATLELPSGLVLAPTPEPQSLTVDVADVAGGTQQEATWIVRGDEEGEYLPAATYSGVLAPVTAPIHLRGETPPDKPVKVWACSALRFVVHPDDHLDQYHPYRVRVGLENVSDVPVYNVSNELKQQGRLGFIYQPLETFKQSTAVIQPGETFWSSYVLMPWIVGGDLSESLSYVTKTGGDCDLEWDIDEQPAPTSRPVATQSVVGANVKIDFDAVPGAVGYDAFATDDVDTLAEYGVNNGLQPDVPFPSTPLTSVEGGSSTSLSIPIDALGDHDWVGLSVRFADGSREMLHNLVKLPSRISIGSTFVTEGDSGTTPMQFPVRLTAPATTPVTVNWAASSGDQPQVGVDYHAASGTVTFQPGETEKIVTVEVIGDDVHEPGTPFLGAPTEWLAVILSAPTGGALLQPNPWANLAFGIIVDDDPRPVVTIDSAIVTEGDTGTTTMQFPIHLSRPSSETTTVDWTTASGDQPEPGIDYEAATGTVTFLPGETHKTIDITIYGDTIPEPGTPFYGLPTEWLAIILTGSTNANLPGGWNNLAFGIIIDDD